MNAQHTPGPWATIHSGKTVVGPPTGTDMFPIPTSPGSRKVIACSIENPADARLILKAPEMLVLLEDCARELAAYDAVTAVLREEHRLPHTPDPVLQRIEALFTQLNA